MDIMIEKLKSGFLVTNLSTHPGMKSNPIGGFTKLSDMKETLEELFCEKFDNEEDAEMPNFLDKMKVVELPGIDPGSILVGDNPLLDIGEQFDNTKIPMVKTSGGANMEFPDATLKIISAEENAENALIDDDDLEDLIEKTYKKASESVEAAFDRIIPSNSADVPKAKHKDIMGFDPELKAKKKKRNKFSTLSQPQQRILAHFEKTKKSVGEDRFSINLSTLTKFAGIRNGEIETHLGLLHRRSYINWEKIPKGDPFFTLIPQPSEA